MHIYVTHSKKMDFRNGLYVPLRNSKINKLHTLVLPHESSQENYSSKKFFREWCHFVIAEVSLPGTGIGIELGWADSYGVPIIAIHKHDVEPPKSVASVTDQFVAYTGVNDMIQKLEERVLNLDEFGIKLASR